MFNWADGTIDETKVYDTGRYFLPSTTFILFESTIQLIEFSDLSTNPNALTRLEARTNDGIDISFAMMIYF